MITTKRLLLRNLASSDLDSLTIMFSSPDVMRFIGPRRPMSKAESTEWLQQQIAIQGQGTTRQGVALRASNLLIGLCGFHRTAIRYPLDKQFQASYPTSFDKFSNLLHSLRRSSTS